MTLLAIILLTQAVLLTGMEKPTIWVYSDMSDPRDQRAGGHPQNDPDDICSLAALLLQANRFDIAGIVYSSTNRRGLKDATAFVNSTFVEAYRRARDPLNAALGGFQESIPFYRSSLYNGSDPEKFDPNADYREIGHLPTVSRLVELASKQPVYVLNWGPLTESAIAIRHCLATGNTGALRNMTILSHWTTSYIAQGTPDTPFKVANCRDDGEACRFLHETAKSNPLVKFIELGSVGQTGIVNGSAGYQGFGEFQGSALGQVFVQSKFYSGKPDQSDASTFWLLTGDFGPSVEDYRTDGTLDQATEERVRDAFLGNAHAILDDLLMRSRIAATGGRFHSGFITARFTYVYQFLDGRYSIYLPFDGRYEFLDTLNRVVLADSLEAGNHHLDLSGLSAGSYRVLVTTGGQAREFSLEVAE